MSHPDAGPLRRVCEVRRRGRSLVAEPFFEVGSPITLGRPGALRAAEGDLVVVESTGRGRARVTEVLGRPDSVADVLHGLAVEAGEGGPFPDAVDRELRSLGDGDLPGDATRRDLRDQRCFTIDPPEAKDFDDALALQREDGGVRMFVHIADVSAFVAAGSATDREAALRSTSVYLPGRVEPMLPEALSAGLCSLQPDVDRRVITVEVAPDGSVAFYRSLIRSKHRLSYPQVERLLAGGGDVPAELRADLSTLQEVTARLRAERFARGAAAISSRELELRLDAGGVHSATMAGEAEAHALVEEQMLVANRRVAEVLAAARAAALHRVHEHPEPESIVRLAQRLAALEVPTPAVPEQFSSQEAAVLAAEMAVSVERTVAATGRGRDAFPSLVLRSLKRARYDRRSLGHSGLAVPAYCHFTSPIRRYPDLICHRALLSRIEDGVPVPVETLDALAEHCSLREREAAALERRGDDVALAFLLDRQLFELGWQHSFDGEIVGLAEGGLFVRFGEVFEGLLPARFLGGEWFDRDELEVALVGRSSGHRYRVGDPIGVSVRSIDRPRGRVLLEPGARSSQRS